MNSNIELNVVILTFNSQESLKQVILSCQDIASRIFVIDSYSSDDTIPIANNLDCQVVQHHFENYSQQRNWSQEYIKKICDLDSWFLHLDSDEVISAKLAESIRKTLDSPEISKIDGFLIQRQSYFLGNPIRFGHINPSWHLRLFKSSKGKCENRLYDQHFIVSGKTQKLEGLLLDLQLTTIEQWTNSHNRWSTAEAREIMGHLNQKSEIERDALPASLIGDLRMQKRWLKNKIYYQSPLLLRAFIFFVYSYFFRLGFLDGKSGLIYHVLQAFWFRFLTDAKIIEQRMEGASKK